MEMEQQILITGERWNLYKIWWKFNANIPEINTGLCIPKLTHKWHKTFSDGVSRQRVVKPHSVKPLMSKIVESVKEVRTLGIKISIKRVKWLILDWNEIVLPFLNFDQRTVHADHWMLYDNSPCHSALSPKFGS